MDESWRMQMGMGLKMPTTQIKHRKSTEQALTPEEFSDVFGGPPKTILRRQFSATDFPRSSSHSFYEEVFKTPENVGPVKDGRSLPKFRIPSSGKSRRKNEEFYNDIFRSHRELKRETGRSKKSTKASSSSELSTEEFSPLRPVIRQNDDGLFSSFASKLRPVNVRSGWNPSTMMHEECLRQQGTPDFPYHQPSYMEKEYNENFKSYHLGFARRVPSPETICLEPLSHSSLRVSMEDLELNSPSSVVSSLCQDQEFNTVGIVQDKEFEEKGTEQEYDEGISSYVIELNSNYREGTWEGPDIDEAIAWAKEKFQSQRSEKDRKMGEYETEQHAEMEEMPSFQQISDDQIHSYGSTQSPEMEMQALDEDLRLWSAGKEANIRLLLSTLHHILWPNSGWYPLSLTNVIESSHVKKAYQKARLCLHPDKLQQRGATLPQRYVAEKAFSILQDAWAAFISQDVFF